jgi:hypothetical protein
LKTGQATPPAQAQRTNLKCHNSECNNDARWQVSWWMLPLAINRDLGVTNVPESVTNVTPKSSEEDKPKRKQIAVTTSTVVCDHHRKTIRYDQISSPESRAGINNYLVSNNKDPLDFTTARPTFTEIIGEELPLEPHCIYTNARLATS